MLLFGATEIKSQYEYETDVNYLRMKRWVDNESEFVLSNRRMIWYNENELFWTELKQTVFNKIKILI